MNIFVARLNPRTTTKNLQMLFEHYGVVANAKVILDRVTGKSKGYGFVEMPDNHEAHEALKELDNTLFQENNISVRESVPNNYRLLTMNSGFRNRNRAVYPSGNRNFRETNNGATSSDNYQREYSSRRNYGYRGSGFRGFK
jgi:RNA recognition motif-containing protein